MAGLRSSHLITSVKDARVYSGHDELQVYEKYGAVPAGRPTSNMLSALPIAV